MTTTRPYYAEIALAANRTYSCHAVEISGLWEYEPHRHVGCCDLTYVHKGEIEQEVNGERSVLTDGMMTFVRDGDVHALQSRQP